jgi:hypothetical protein
MIKRYQNIVLSCCLIFLFLPLVKQFTGFPNIKPLAGVFTVPEKDSLNLDNWFSASFQQSFIPYYEYQIGYRPDFVRIRNQWVYSIYGKSTNTTLIGKEGQLLDYFYHKTFVGPPKFPVDSIHERIHNLSKVIDTLESKGKTTLVVIAPNKADVLREYLPDDYTSIQNDSNAYQYTLSFLDNYNVDYLDFNKMFRENWDSYPYPLLSNTGVHWTGYGIHVANTHILDKLGEKSQRQMPEQGVKSWSLSNDHKTYESDLANYMDLIFPPKTQPLAQATYEAVDTNRKKLNVLIIGDSFFFNYFSYPQMTQNLFDSRSKFWYYSKTQIGFDETRVPTKELSAHEACDSADFIIFLASAYNMKSLPFGFAKKYLNEN